MINKKFVVIIIRSTFNDKLYPVKNVNMDGKQVDVSIFLYWDEFETLVKTVDALKDQCEKLRRERLASATTTTTMTTTTQQTTEPEKGMEEVNFTL
jgi:hypothetical protein